MSQRESAPILTACPVLACRGPVQTAYQRDILYAWVVALHRGIGRAYANSIGHVETLPYRIKGLKTCIRLSSNIADWCRPSLLEGGLAHPRSDVISSKIGTRVGASMPGTFVIKDKPRDRRRYWANGAQDDLLKQYHTDGVCQDSLPCRQEYLASGTATSLSSSHVCTAEANGNT
jgi:hypothetical protein